MIRLGYGLTDDDTCSQGSRPLLTRPPRAPTAVIASTATIATATATVAADQGCEPCDNPMGFGTIGLALNGVSFFSSLSIDYVDAISPPVWSTYPEESLDRCIAHPNAGGTYHYHYMPMCMFGYNTTQGEGHTEVPAVGNTACYDNDCPDDYKVQTYDGDANYASDGSGSIIPKGFKKGSALEPIGVMIDGYMIMGPYNTSGETITGLDNCNGKWHDGE